LRAIIAAFGRLAIFNPDPDFIGLGHPALADAVPTQIEYAYR
jgi:hypothetical protein